MLLWVMALVLKPVGAASAKVVALAVAAEESPPALLAMTFSVYAVFAVKLLKV